MGKLTVKVTIRQAEAEAVPRVEVDGFLGTVHVLLSPQQLHMMQEIAKSLMAQADAGVSEFSRLAASQGRPISHGDMTTIESQLAHQQQQEQHRAKAVHQIRRRRGQDLLDADPWENSIPQTTPLKSVARSSSASGADDFYSLDLNSSLTSSVRTDMDESFVSANSRLPHPSPLGKGVARGMGGATVHRRHLEGDDVDALHEGVGLQQLSQSPPSIHKHCVPRSSPSLPHKSCAPQLRSTPHPSCMCTLTLSGVTLALLEADPSHTYTASNVGGSTGEEASMDEGGLDTVKYFELVSELLKDGVNRHQLALHQEQLAQVLPADHLMLWVSVVRASACVEDERRWEGELTLGYGEMWEYLYHNHTRINHIIKPVSVSPILQLHGNHTLTPPRPGLKLKIVSCPVTSNKKSQADSIQTDVEAFLSELHTNFDLTLVDRLQLLLSRPSSSGSSSKTSSLHPEKVKHSLYMTSSNIHTIHQQRQAVFNQAVAPPTTAQSKKHHLHIKISGDVIHASLRFPVPDCGQTQHPPWFKSSLRPETLFVEMTGWGFTSQLHSLALAGVAPCKLDFQFSLIEAYLSMDGSVEGRELFLAIAKRSQVSSSPTIETAPTIRLVVQPELASCLEQKPQPTPYTQMLDLLEESMAEDIKTDPQPFSQRKSMFSASDISSKSAGGKQEAEVHSEELVLPGTVEEMKEFADFASSTARYHLDCFFPEVRVHLPSKQFLETLYNRLGSDLTLWEPATPTAVSKANAKSVMYNCMDLLQPAATSEERFLMCRSVLQEELSDEDGEQESSPTLRTPPEGRGRGHSFLALSLRVEEGVISMFPEALNTADSSPNSDPLTPHPAGGTSGIGLDDSALFHSTLSERPNTTLVQLSSPGARQGEQSTAVRGVAIMELASVHAFFVSGFEGEDAACAWVQSMALYHHGNPGCSTADYAQYCSVNAAFDISVCSQLLPVFGPAPILSAHSAEQPILSLAMEMKVDKDLSTKTSKVAVCVSDAVMSYHFSPPGLGAILQLAEFLDLHEEVIVGYESPSLVTELHAHLVTSSMVYGPLYLPLVATLVLDSVSLSTSVVTGAPVHVVRVVLDGLHLVLTPSRGGGPTPSSVCVLDVDWLELTLRHCDNAQLDNAFQRLFSKMPDVSVECASNVLHVRTCADSCIALSDLLLYLSSQRDLAPPPSPAAVTRDYCSLPSSLSATSAPHSEKAQARETQQQQQQQRDAAKEGGDIGDLITSAMEDSPPSSPAGKMKGRIEHSSHKVEVRMSGDSLLMDFDSDSDNDDMGAGSKVSKSSPSGGGARTEVLPTRGRVLAGNIFSDSDEDDFCIVNTPTSTKVAPGAEPKVKRLLEEGETLDIIEDHFTIPDGMMDQLHRPRSFPEAKTQCTLKDMTVVWHLYGGRDFADGKPNRPPDRELRSLRKSQLRYWGTRDSASVYGSSLKTGGGIGRDHSILVEVELNKVRIQHETYPRDSEQSSRLVILVGDVEMRDRLADSNINKLLYQYTTEAMPKQSHASMVTLKAVFTQPELPHQQDLEEASVYLSVLPIRLNMDQDTVLFLYEFARLVSGTSQLPNSSTVEPVRCQVEELSTPDSGRSQPHPLLQGGAESKSRLVFIKSFVFQPDLPIRIDYEAKGFKTEIGTMAGILFGLSHLNNSEVRLKALHYKKGLLGWDKLVEYCTTEWLNDIRGYQLPLLLKGVGPMYNVTQLVYGVMDFVRLPYQQYQEDGRLVWGIQRGTTALTSSTGVAVVELTSQLLETIQGLAQMAYDMVSPPSDRQDQRPLGHHQHKPYQPLDFREGFSNAYDVVYDGIGGTAVDLYSVASKEHNERGMAGAVGGVLRHLPGTLVKPIILASEATRHVLGGVKNQFVPDARKEATEKWKTNEQFEESRTL